DVSSISYVVSMVLGLLGAVLIGVYQTVLYRKYVILSGSYTHIDRHSLLGGIGMIASSSFMVWVVYFMDIGISTLEYKGLAIYFVWPWNVLMGYGGLLFGVAAIFIVLASILKLSHQWSARNE